ELSHQLVEVSERLLGLRVAPVRLSHAQVGVAETERVLVVFLGGDEVAAHLSGGIEEGNLALRVLRVDDAEGALDAVLANEAVVVFCSWLDAEAATRELLERVQGSAWFSAVVPVVLTSG